MSVRAPVVFIIFNRPDLTQRVFAEIAKAQPATLLVIADGPRHADEGAACDAARRVLDAVDWPCDLRRHFSDVNMGCKQRVASGLDWVFGQVEEAIILEDDCLPHPDFFTFCDQMLERYRDDTRIGHIAGTDYNPGPARGEGSYYYSRYTSIWGWATWRRAWDAYDVGMPDWPSVKSSGAPLNMLGTEEEGSHFSAVWDDIYNGETDTWDGQWLFARLWAGSLAIAPNGNLISNLGCREDATHTTLNAHPFAKLAFGTVAFPLVPPGSMQPDDEADLIRARAEFLAPAHGGRKWIQKLKNKHLYGLALRRLPVVGPVWAHLRDRHADKN